MARATIGIAMGAAGSDAAIETADVALMSDDLSKLPWLIGHSKRAVTINGRRIVHAVANHRDRCIAPDQVLDSGDLVGGQ